MSCRVPHAFRRLAPLWRCALLLLLSACCIAEPPQIAPGQFYRQLIPMDPRPGYRPTRSYTVVRDATGDRLVARDDPQLAFNLLWLEQHDPAYRYREGGAAFGKLVRSLLKNAWRNYREDHAQQLAGAPDAEGNGSLERFSEDTDYRLRWSDDEVTIAVEYAF